MLNILFLILGTTLAHRGRRGGRQCRTEIVDLATQNGHLVDALKPFTEAASGGDDGADGAVLLSTAATTCVMRGLTHSWPHEEAENPPAPFRRLLRWGGPRHRRPKQNLRFDVDSKVFGALQTKSRDDSHCYADGSVQFSVTTDVVTNLAETVARRELRGGGGRGHHGHRDSNDEEREEPTPYAVVTITQTNTFADPDAAEGDATVPVSFDITMTCRPWYKFVRGEEGADGEEAEDSCDLRGLKCYNGEYSFFSTDSDETEQEENERWFRSMKCSSAEDFADEWDECTAP